MIHHPDIYTSIKHKFEPPAKIPKQKQDQGKQTLKTNYVNSNMQLKVNISIKKIIDACVTIVTTDGRPFTFIQDKGFRMLIDPLIDSLKQVKAVDSRFNLNRHNIKQLVNKQATEIVKQVKNKVKDKILSVKIDCCTRLETSYLGVNVQFREYDGTFCLYTLGVIEMDTEHTAVNLKEKMLNLFKIFDISLDQIYSITSDNGSNMLKTIKILCAQDHSYTTDQDLSPIQEVGIEVEIDNKEQTSDTEDSDSDNEIVEDELLNPTHTEILIEEIFPTFYTDSIIGTYFL